MTSSDPRVIQVFVEVQCRPVPVPDEGALGRLPELAAHHVAYKVKGLRDKSEEEFTYLLAGGLLVWIELAELERTEHHLNRCCRV